MTKQSVILGKYRCEECKHNFHGTCDLRRRLESKTHKPRPKNVYNCSTCDFTTLIKRDIIRHLHTPRHFKKLRKELMVEIRNYTRSRT